MRKPKQAVAATRQRIVATAALQLCQHGIDGLGVANLMEVAGLTAGGFYRHFESKEQLVAEACTAAAESLAATMTANAVRSAEPGGLGAVVAGYLSRYHRDHPAGGCPFTALGGELARRGDGTRAAASAGILHVVQTLATLSRQHGQEEALERAMAAFATMTGALMMSRLVADRALSDQILQVATKYLAGWADHAVAVNAGRPKV
jgi:TetR/AcrR family transcriptional repressor of nem operon